MESGSVVARWVTENVPESSAASGLLPYENAGKVIQQRAGLDLYAASARGGARSPASRLRTGRRSIRNSLAWLKTQEEQYKLHNRLTRRIAEFLSLLVWLAGETAV